MGPLTVEYLDEKLEARSWAFFNGGNDRENRFKRLGMKGTTGLCQYEAFDN